MTSLSKSPTLLSGKVVFITERVSLPVYTTNPSAVPLAKTVFAQRTFSTDNEPSWEQSSALILDYLKNFRLIHNLFVMEEIPDMCQQKREYPFAVSLRIPHSSTPISASRRVNFEYKEQQCAASSQFPHQA
jgi:hypothetical protein